MSVETNLVSVDNRPATLAVDLDFFTAKNKDTKGYLHIPSISLGIPVVQSDDNEYYLTHDFYGNENRLGWVFLDSRSYSSKTEENTLIYGHNVVADNMFGDLKSLLETKDKTHYIYYNTGTSKRVYEIVSIYVTHYEDWGYTQSQFTEQEKKEFISRVKARNTVEIIKDKPVIQEDRFLTLSTCYGVIGTTKRLVVHAKLVRGEKI